MDDYYAADLFRSHGNRGSTYLFLKWCAVRYGPDLLPDSGALQVVRHNQPGGMHRRDVRGALQRLDAGSHSSFPRAATIARLRSEDQLPRRENPPPPEDWVRGGPRLARVAAGGQDRWDALGTTSHYVIVDGSKSGAVEIEVSGPTDARLQVTAVLLGGGRPRLDLSVGKTTTADGELFLRARIKESHGEPVKLTQLSWEPFSPGPSRRGSRGSRGRLDEAGLEQAMGSLTLAATGELTSQPIHLRARRSSTGPWWSRSAVSIRRAHGLGVGRPGPLRFRINFL